MKKVLKAAWGVLQLFVCATEVSERMYFLI